MMCGGYGEIKDADDSIQQIIDKVRDTVETRLGQKFGEYKAVRYISQVVAGTNFKIKVSVGDDVYLHVKVFKPLPHTGGLLEFKEAECNKTLADEL